MNNLTDAGKKRTTDYTANTYCMTLMSRLSGSDIYIRNVTVLFEYNAFNVGAGMSCAQTHDKSGYRSRSYQS